MKVIMIIKVMLAMTVSGGSGGGVGGGRDGDGGGGVAGSALYHRRVAAVDAQIRSLRRQRVRDAIDAVIRDD